MTARQVYRQGLPQTVSHTVFIQMTTPKLSTTFLLLGILLCLIGQSLGAKIAAEHAEHDLSHSPIEAFPIPPIVGGPGGVNG